MFYSGENEEEALKYAKEVILCYLEGMEKINEIKTKPGLIAKEVEVTIWVVRWYAIYKKKMELLEKEAEVYDG